MLVIGDTGCGKSTLLSALVNGPDSLYLKKIPVQTPVKKKGQETTYKTTFKFVIDYKDEVKERVFPIGHQANVSETFFPGFQEVPNQPNSYFIDIAGLKDTGGEMMEFVNQFINKKIFSATKNLKILIPFTVETPNLNRGGAMIAQLEILMKTF